MKIIIIGASGLIGSHLYETLKKKKINVIGTYFKNKKFKNFVHFDLLKHSISKLKITGEDIIILLSAKTNPGWVSKNKNNTKKLNVEYTKKFINKIIKIGAKIVFMSSVEVFDGKKNNFNENDKPKPLNFYGKTKLDVERFIQKNSKNYLIFRTSWNSDISLHNRCVIELTYKSILNKNAKMAKDNLFCVTHVKDTVNLIIKNIFIKNKIIHISNTQKISRSNLAKLIKQKSKKGGEMFYKITRFKDIDYLEPRGLKNILVSNVETVKKYKFKSIEFILNKKIKLLDTSNINLT